LLEYDEKVAAYWHEFGQAGKEQVTVRQLLGHQAGLCAIDTPLTLDVLADPDQVAQAIAAQKPVWTPGQRHGYHALSLGWYESELLRRVDPQQRTLGQYFQEEIARPLALEFYIGLPSAIPLERIATLERSTPREALFNLRHLPLPLIWSMVRRDPLLKRVFGNPSLAGNSDHYAERRLLEVEMPAANGVGQVRSIAKVYSEFATGGKGLGLKAHTLEALQQPSQRPQAGVRDMVLQVDLLYSLGFGKPSPNFSFGSPTAFGTPGAGGSFGFADPQYGLGFAYAMNKGGGYLWDDPREKALRKAVYQCLPKSTASAK
jgi:CubicO group peptidase (beta-lactamase class C family)